MATEWHRVLDPADLPEGRLTTVPRRSQQRAGAWDGWQTELRNPDFSKYAELCGALGIGVPEASQLDDALERALAHEGPAMVEVVADPELV